MRTRGFTLIELLVVMSIAALLATLAAAPLMRQVQQARISGGVNTFLADLRFARGEAIRRSSNVTLCRSNAPEADPPSCATGAQGNGWVSGWLIFQDANNNGLIDAGEIILRVHGPITGIDSIVKNSGATVVFTATGRLRNATLVTSLQFGGSSFATDMKRCVRIGAGGRARIDPGNEC